MPLRCDKVNNSVSTPDGYALNIDKEKISEAAIDLKKSPIAASGKKGTVESSPPRALQSWLNEGSLNLVGSGAIAAARSIPSTAGC